MSETPAPRAAKADRAMTVSALFRTLEGVEAALARLNTAGVPRDLVEVVASPEAASRFFGARKQPRQREVFRYAGIGGLTGLVVGVVISLVMVAAPGFQEEEVTAVVQLLGPNFCTVTGALLGALRGYFVTRRPRPWHARADQPDTIVVGVTAREQEVAFFEEVLRSHGGEQLRVE